MSLRGSPAGTKRCLTMKDADFEPSVDKRFPSVTLRDLTTPLFRRKKVLGVTFLVVLAAALLVGALTPPQYTSHMTVLVNRERLDAVVTTEPTTQLVADGNTVSEEDMHSEAELMKSRDLLERVVLATGLEKHPRHSLFSRFAGHTDEASSVERAVRGLEKGIDAQPVNKANLIKVAYSSSNPRVAHDVLATLGNLYLDKRIALHRPQGSYEFFAQQTDKYHKALEDAESRLKNFEMQQGAEAPDLERADIAVQLSNSIGQFHSSEQAKAADEQRIRTDEQQMQGIPQRSPTLQSTAPADRLLEDLHSALLTAQTNRARLAMKFDPHYPLVQEADEEIAATNAAIANAEKQRFVTQSTDRDPTFELLREDRTRTQSDLAGQRAASEAIRRSIDSLRAQMSDLDTKSLTLQDLQREVRADESNYLFYLSKREQERTSDALDRTRIANAVIAVPPEVPALPSRAFGLLIAAAIGLAGVCAIALAYLVEHFDPSFQTPSDVMDILGIPVVISMPKKVA